MNRIYLDNSATTFLLPEVALAMQECLGRRYANPASMHTEGQRARRFLEETRGQIAAILGADVQGRCADHLVFTSGGTEANNLALRGLAGRGPAQVIVSPVEHPSIAGPAQQLARQDISVRHLSVDALGLVNPDQLRTLARGDVRLVSVMLANHETGVLQPIAGIAAVCAESGVPVHTDAVQAVGKMTVNFRELGAAALSFSAHKFHGPVGIGGLLLRHDVLPDPLLFGGSQQRGIRPGTESLALAVGMLRALQLWQDESEKTQRHLEYLRNRFEELLRAEIPGLLVNGEGAPRTPHTTNVSFPGVDRQVMLMALDAAGIACSTGSACASGASEPSAVLRAMGLAESRIGGALRFAFSRLNTEEEVAASAARISRAYKELHAAHGVRKQPATSRLPGGKPL
jgi:cysteine desulfurase